jgi:hypothetical protein
MPMDPRLMRPKRRAAGDPYWANVELLLHFDGPSFVDSSSNDLAITTNGSPTISTAQSKFGGASGLFGPVSNYLNAPGDLSSGSYTIEAWFYAAQDHSGDLYAVLSGGSGGSRQYPNRWSFELGVGEGSITMRAAGTNNDPIAEHSGDYTLSTWVHVAWVHDDAAETLSFYLGGERIAIESYSFNPIDYGDLLVGQGSSGVNGFNGEAYYLDELRITKGVARYSGESFPVPTAPFPNG